MDRSRIPGFYKLSVRQRLEILKERDLISAEDFKLLSSGGNVLDQEGADKMIENVIGVFSLPIGLGLNFLINGKDYIVPMVVEEPSIVAAVSAAAKLVRQAGGFIARTTDPILIGQVQVVDIEHPSHAKKAILQNKEEILNLANSFHPNMVARGGGAKDVEVNIHPNACHRGDMLVVHLLVDTCDAMGANLVNTMCEGIAGLIEKITNGKVFLRILSNLADRSLVTAECVIPTHLLSSKKGYTGEQVRDGIILANEFAMVDPYRAATHNKGILNGIDPVAIATGNDWRAIEASVHAYAARGSHYTSLTRWSKNENGDLVGQIKLPLKVGIVGGPVQSNPSVGALLRILKVQSARELMEVMGAVGLAQNLSAIKALSTEGIQQGHMTLHARTVAMAADAPPDLFDEVVDRLIQSGEIKVWKAEEIVRELREKPVVTARKKETEIRADLPAGYGKVILFGEHAAVYGSHVIAAPIPIAIQAKVIDADDGIYLIIPRWGVEERLARDRRHEHSIYQSLDVILNTLELADRNMKIEIFPHIPRAMGLGGSAALAVAIIRALSEHFRLNLSDEQVNDLAFKSEQIVHGTPSGIDNTMATYGQFILFRRGTPPLMKPLAVEKPISLVIGITGVESLTAKMVANVRRAWEKNKMMYERIFTEINALALRAMKAIVRNDLETLGELMNINQGLLNAIQVSSWELEELIEIARKSGALGAKLTGGGGGGAMIALPRDAETAEEIAANMRKAGYRAMVTQIG